MEISLENRNYIWPHHDNAGTVISSQSTVLELLLKLSTFKICQIFYLVGKNSQIRTFCRANFPKISEGPGKFIRNSRIGIKNNANSQVLYVQSLLDSSR